MAIKIRRGLEADRTSVIFEEGEVLYTTDTKSFFIGDGVTAGGNQIGGTTAASLLKTTVHNATGSTLTKGQVVYLNGNTGNKPNAVLAQADSEATSSKTIGLIITNISNNANGDIATDGLISDLNTSAFAAGDLLWLSDSVAGGVTTIMPDTPNNSVFIGYVVEAHPTQGKILIHIQNGYELNELHDVKITSVANGDVLAYDSTLGYWKNAVSSSFTPPNGLLKIASAISTTFQAVTDYLGNTSVLFLNSRRIGIGKDTSVTTQSVAVVEVQDANTSIVLKPNGTGAIIASVPDGTATGGNARGSNAVDLQSSRANANQVANGVGSFVAGSSSKATSTNCIAIGDTCTASNTAAVALGYGATASGQYSFSSGAFSTASGQLSIAMGQSTASATYSIALGSSNNATSNYSTISGGQSNTASTNTHATVVGGQSNTSSGNGSISGGQSNSVTGQFSVGFGWANTVSGVSAFSFGTRNSSTQSRSISFGDYAFAYITGQMSHSNGRFSITGDAQISNIVARNTASLTSASTLILYADGVSSVILPDALNRIWNVQIDTIAVVTGITGTATGVSVGDVYSEVKNLLFKRIGGTSSIVGSVDTSFIKSNSGMSTAAITITAGASQQMAITFTAPTFVGAGSITCRVVSKVSLVECAY